MKIDEMKKLKRVIDITKKDWAKYFVSEAVEGRFGTRETISKKEYGYVTYVTEIVGRCFDRKKSDILDYTSFVDFILSVIEKDFDKKNVSKHYVIWDYIEERALRRKSRHIRYNDDCTHYIDIIAHYSIGNHPHYRFWNAGDNGSYFLNKWEIKNDYKFIQDNAEFIFQNISFFKEYFNSMQMNNLNFAPEINNYCD